MKKMNKKTLIITAVVIVLLLGGFLVIKKARMNDAATPVAKSYAIVVSTLKPVKKQVNLILPYLALAENDRDVNLASKISARIKFIKPSGSKVKKGSIVARLDNTGIASDINSVQAQAVALNTALKNLRETHKRTLELIKVGGASIEQSQNEESKIADLVSKKEGLNQKLNELEDMLSYAVITSPVDGNISKTMANFGDMALPGRPIATIRAGIGFYLLVRVPSDLSISGVIMGNKKYDAIPLNSSFNGLSEYKVYVGSQNMTSGDRVEVDVEVYNGDAIKLPFDAILNRNGKNYVMVREGDHAVANEVSIVQSGEDGVVVSNSELEGKELVVAKQDILLRLLSGTSIKVKEG